MCDRRAIAVTGENAFNSFGRHVTFCENEPESSTVNTGSISPRLNGCQKQPTDMAY